MRIIKLLICAVAAAAVLTGCSSESIQERSDLEFVVMEERSLPEELQEILEENKEKEIRMSYKDGEDLYLIRGYGEQETGGYSIAVKECTEDEERIVLDTTLIGPKNAEELKKTPSYPCLVLKVRVEGEREIQIQ